MREGVVADGGHLNVLDVLQGDVHVLRQLGRQPVLNGCQGIQVHQVLYVGLQCVLAWSTLLEKFRVNKLVSVLNMNRLRAKRIEERVDKEVMICDERLQLNIIFTRLETLHTGVQVGKTFHTVSGSPIVLIFVEYSPLFILRQNGVHLPLPIFPLKYRPRLRLVVVVKFHGIGKGTNKFPVTLDELHVPASPDHIVQSELVFPSELHSQEPVPLGGGELLSVGDGHALEEFGQRDIYQRSML